MTSSYSYSHKYLWILSFSVQSTGAVKYTCNIMAGGGFVLYMLPFGLVRLRTFRSVHGLVRCKHRRRCARAHGEDVSFRDVKIKIPGWKCDQEVWMTSCTGSVGWGFLRIWEKSVSWVLASERESWVLASEEDGWLSELAEAFRWEPHVVGGRWKSRHRKIVPLSSLCRKTF